jgi:hypothetical protein
MYQQTNQLLKDYATRTPNVFYIHPATAIDTALGTLDPTKFGPDKLHPKPEVYTWRN